MNPLVDKALKLHQDSENARQEAITSLLGEQKTIADQLKALGHVEGQKTAKKGPAPVNPEKVCAVCQQKGHDGRFHRRNQNVPPPPPAKPETPKSPAAVAK
jgi:hypothetical protein